MKSKLVEDLCIECDRLTAENQKLRDKIHEMAVSKLRVFQAGEAVTGIETGEHGIVQRYMPNGLVEVLFEGRVDFDLIHCGNIIPRVESLNISYRAVMNLIAMALSLQAYVYGDPTVKISKKQIDETLSEVRGEEANKAFINRLKLQGEKSCQ